MQKLALKRLCVGWKLQKPHGKQGEDEAEVQVGDEVRDEVRDEVPLRQLQDFSLQKFRVQQQ
jgi:hypothetical protein